MPRTDAHCPNCSYSFEAYYTYPMPRHTTCPRCHHPQARMLFPSPQFNVPQYEETDEGIRIRKSDEDPWRGHALEGSDGINELDYVPTKSVVDLAQPRAMAEPPKTREERINDMLENAPIVAYEEQG